MSDLPVGLTAAEIAIAFGVAVISAFIRGLSGFGLALMLVPVLALTVAPEDAVVTANALGILLGLASFHGARRGAESSAKTIAMLAVVLTPAGLALLALTPPDLARVAISMIAVAAFLILFLPRPKHSVGQGFALAGSTGIVSGLCAGFAGMPGPPVVAYYLVRKVQPAVARSSMFLIFLATSLAACVAAFVLDIASMATVWLTAILTPGVLLGNWLGGLAFGKVPEPVWRLIAGAIVGVSAAFAVVKLFS